MTVAGRRRAFALEPEVWFVLEAMARADNRPLGSQIDHLLTAAEPRNASAELRLAAIRWQGQALALARRNSALLLRQVISAIPAAACALSQGQAILARNTAFRELQCRLTDQPDDALSTRLYLGAPLPRIAGVLATDSGRAVSVPFALRSREGASLTGQLNVSCMQGDGQEPVFLCVVRPVSP